MTALEQLAEALRKKEDPRPPGYLTREEFQLALGIQQAHANALLRRLRLAGLLEVIPGRVPLYRSDAPGWPGSGNGGSESSQKPGGGAPGLGGRLPGSREVVQAPPRNAPLDARGGRRNGRSKRLG